MAGVTLLAEARQAGLTVWAEGEQLVVRGPGAAEGLARALLAHKAEVLAILATEPDFPRFRVSAFPRSMQHALLAADDPAVTWRVAAMRRHLPASGPLPFLTARPVPRGQAGCQSCGEPLAPRTNGEVFRCAPCAHAAWLVVTEHTARALAS